MPGQLAALVRQKYPGSYDDLPDADLEKAVLAKHPEYQDLATAPEKPLATATTADLMRERAQPGGVRKVMTEGEMVNPPGFIDRLNATMQGPAHPSTVGDLLTSILPSSMGFGGARQVVGKGAAAVADAIPTRAKAGVKFQDVMGAAKNATVDVQAPGQSALRIQELADRGASMPLVARKFLRRITDPNLGDLTYGEARDFASNISRLSADEYKRLTPVVRREVANLAATLNESIASTAKAAGKGAEYLQAMTQYRRASQLRDLWTTMIEGGKKALPAVGAGGVGYYLVKKAKETFGGE